MTAAAPTLKFDSGDVAQGHPRLTVPATPVFVLPTTAGRVASASRATAEFFISALTPVHPVEAYTLVSDLLASFTQSPAITLTKTLPRGFMIQTEVRQRLQAFQTEGLITSFEEGEIGAGAVTFKATVPLEHWNIEDRGRIHEAALALQEEHHVVVMIDLQRERKRAELT